MEEALEEGSFDWEAWKHELEPFLGGLTAKERDVLLQQQ
jgi:hypothetical protein